MAEQSTKSVNPLFAALHRSLDEEQRFALVERAAIAEYDGGLTQDEAEKLAYDLWRQGRLTIE